MLSKGALTALIVAFNDLEQTALVVGCSIFANNNRGATVILTNHASVHAACLVLV